MPENLPKNIQTVLDTLSPLTHDRGERELFYQYSVGNLEELSDQDAKWAITELAARGVGVITNWTHGASQDDRIAEGLRIGKIQHSLGLSVVVDANGLLNRFYDETDATAHIDSAGEFFWDDSFAGSKMGCPFAIEHRKPIILARVAAYVEAYHMAGVPVSIATADWEIDGPHEWNKAWEHSKRCTRCRANLPNIDDFSSFQSVLRKKRAELMMQCYSTPILNRNPKALVTNYGVYPNDGWRYWYDYFETRSTQLPHRMDQKFPYRPWYDEFAESGFTLAMPVVYTWGDIYDSYPDFSDPDYRWFYNMLMVGSNAGKSTPKETPIATFLHWHTTAATAAASQVPQMSEETYKDLLWHLLFRGHDIFYSWTPMDQLAKEVSLVQEVYNNSLQYSDWLAEGKPISFDVPSEQGPVVSGLLRGNQVLLLRTDFGGMTDPMTVSVGRKSLQVISKPGKRQVLDLR